MASSAFRSKRSTAQASCDGGGLRRSARIRGGEPFGIHVTLVEPGNFKTEFTASRRDVPPIECGEEQEGGEGENPYASASAKAITVMERDEAMERHLHKRRSSSNRFSTQSVPPRDASLQERWTSE